MHALRPIDLRPAGPHPIRVAVIGGGVLGASTAAHLVRAGAQVTLLTAGSVADGASGRSLSWLNSSGARSPEYHALRLLGIDRYRTWLARNPGSARWLRFDGALKWARPGESLRATFELERSRGYDAVWLDRAAVAARLPEVRAEAVAEEGAIFNPGEGWVDLPYLVAALVDEAVAGGAQLIEGAGSAEVVIDDGAVRGVRLADGRRIDADRVVLATGAGAPAQLAALGVTVPDATVPACLVVTDPLPAPVRTVLNTPRVAVRPRPDGGVSLDAGWAERSVVVGADGALSVPAATIDGLLAEASAVLAARPRLTVSRVGIGPKPIPGDGEPVVGAVGAVPGLSVLFTHSGATLGLILGELLAEEIATGAPSPVLAPFRIERFAAGATVAEAGSGAWTPVAQR
ncbi:NAD(P)/FAD-dependent oxidoreductase [Agromyces aerolatus]|uniref:NAD(P)/FAD-dependent oxidoreductase n=1 Tax=Agromyces sp. LY-1074 TaxID=3074080 RepID=UPI00285D4D13|nr:MULTISPECIES: FAD-binding oxidoreductase [unclassified Agromyces]MDR5698772.1 FAD-binding oxidoreductase [Agromyces sp. LY-1074]MDR5705066.1 FAD-binding oxidoreductase [Agromyces sp. LY-1358]